MDVYTWLTRPWPGSSGAVFFYELLLALCEFCLLIWEHLKKHPVCTCCDSLTMLLTFKLGNLSSVSVFCLCVHLWLYAVTPQSFTNNSVSFLTWGPNYQPDSPCMCPVGARGFLCLNKDETITHTCTHTQAHSLRGSDQSSIWRGLWLSVSMYIYTYYLTDSSFRTTNLLAQVVSLTKYIKSQT